MDNISIGSDDSGSTTYERRQFASTLVTSTDDYDSILVAMEEETIVNHHTEVHIAHH